MSGLNRVSSVDIATTSEKPNSDHKSWKLMLAGLFQLTKPTIALLVVVTAIPGVLFAQDGLPDVWLLAKILFGTWLTSCSAAVFNQVVESGLDKTMQRTSSRSIPAGVIPKPEAHIVRSQYLIKSEYRQAPEPLSENSLREKACDPYPTKQSP